ncbi:MAG TPA: arylamine N-acetyltransferase [Bacteriovoracaceae bacterium]|nr:arylamine N-acetyltransferase [Bacteriovoracaceae bacterium]
MKTNLYLEKLKLKPEEPSLDFLNKIIAAHQRTISFNNLAVFFRPGEILDLDIEPLVEKVVLRGEGGYCFENNKVLYYLLKNLGFKVEAKLARVIYDREGDIPRTHRTTIVTISDERFIADVGFGRDAPPFAVPFTSSKSTNYQIVWNDHSYTLQFLKGPSVISLYSFDEGVYLEADFNVANYYTNTHPSSKFVNELIVARMDQGVIEFINGKVYSRIENGERENKEIFNQQDFDSHLKKFGIEAMYDFSKVK